MASAFSHIAIPAALYATFKSKSVNFKLFFMAGICSVIPDADVVEFKFGIPYESQWGHRGFTHSLVFAFVLAWLCVLFHRQVNSRPWVIFWLCFLSCASHPLLDAMTNGGLGVALYWPFSAERIFLPFRPIQVSPIGVGRFFTEQGVAVIKSEFIWVLIPSFVFGIVGVVIRRKLRRNF
jgi:inner membrane protein